MARTPEFPAQARGEAAGRGLRSPKPPAHPTALAGCPCTPCHPHTAPAPEGTPRPGAGGAPASLGAEERMRRRDPATVEQSTSRAGGALAEPLLCPLPSRSPGNGAAGDNKKATCTFLVTTAKANLRPGWGPPAAPRGGQGLQGSAGRSGKPKLGLLKGTYRKTMRQIRCRLYKGINTKELDASLCFGAAQSKSWGQGPPAVPWHRDTNTAQSPQRRGQG